MINKSSAELTAAELSKDEYLKIAKNNGPILQIVFGGGEPFLRKDIAEIAEAFYTHSSVRLLSIPTNGSLPQDILETSARISRNCRKAIVNIEISIDAYGEKHDRLRSFPGLFKKTISLCHEILDLRKQFNNLNPVVNITVTEQNINDVAELQLFLMREFMHSPLFYNVLYDCRSNAGFFSDPEAVKKIIMIESKLKDSNRRHSFNVFRRIISIYYIEFINKLLCNQRLKQRAYYHCNAGKKIYVILPDGRVSPCEPFIFEDICGEFRLLNLRDFEYTYDRLRQNPGYVKMLRFTDKGKCGACHWSCSAITSMLYSSRNWLKALTVRDVSKLFEQEFSKQ